VAIASSEHKRPASRFAAPASNNERDRSSCLPGLHDAFAEHPIHARLFSALSQHTDRLRILLDAVNSQPTYERLLARAMRLGDHLDSSGTARLSITQ
jgi:hypothetical protein